MTKTLTTALFLVFFFPGCSSSRPRIGDQRLDEGQVPPFLRDYARGIPEADFYQKWMGEEESFYEVKNEHVSISVSTSGELIEKEEDLTRRQVPATIMTKMEAYLRDQYPGAKITEIEARTTAAGLFFDLEIRHPSSPSGYWELVFTKEQGEFVAREIEDLESPLTLN